MGALGDSGKHFGRRLAKVGVAIKAIYFSAECWHQHGCREHEVRGCAGEHPDTKASVSARCYHYVEPNAGGRENHIFCRAGRESQGGCADCPPAAVELVEGDLVQAMAARTDSFDLVASTCVLYHIADLAPFFREAARLLVPGGHLFFSVDPAPDSMDIGVSSPGEYAHSRAYLRRLATKTGFAETAIKTFSVGYPNQAALDAFLTLRREHGLTLNNVDRVVVRLPEDGARIVDNSPMPDVNCQYLIAVALIDGTVSFADSHSHERMKDPSVLAVKERVQLVADRALMNPEAPRSGMVEVTLRDGRKVSHFTRHPPGTKENPLNTEGVNEKARSLMAPVLGVERTDAIIRRVNALEELDDVRNLLTFLTL